MSIRVNQHRTKLAGAAWLIAAAIASWSAASEPALFDTTADPFLRMTNWQVTPGEPVVDPLVEPIAPVPAPPMGPPVAPDGAPLLDDALVEEIVPPMDVDDTFPPQRGVRPYGGGHPGDWPWGCGGSPFRTGPGFCDTWDVGCRWDVAVDGMVMTREDTDLTALADQIVLMDPAVAGDLPMLEQFDHAPGGRVSLISKVPHYDWQMHAGYEGIEEWNASIVYPKEPLNPIAPEFMTEQHRFHYRSSLHSGELNFVRLCSPVWRPYCGVRYVKFDDEINDLIDEQAAPPLPDDFAGGPTTSVTTTDTLNLFDVENNLIGFQIGIRHDLWRPMRRLTIEGFVNTGVYYNKVKYTNLMGSFTTQVFADDTSTLDDIEARTDRANSVNNDVSELSEISYITEASISGVCRLNKCWALRAGYQALWITDVHLAEDAFLNGDTVGRDMFFHGWHAGVEHRR